MYFLIKVLVLLGILSGPSDINFQSLDHQDWKQLKKAAVLVKKADVDWSAAFQTPNLLELLDDLEGYNPGDYGINDQDSSDDSNSSSSSSKSSSSSSANNNNSASSSKLLSDWDLWKLKELQIQLIVVIEELEL